MNGKRDIATAIASATLAFLCGCAHELDAPGRADAPLPTGRWLEGGFAEASQDVGSLPVNLLLSPDGKYAVTTGAGSRQELWSIGTADGRGVSHLDYQTSADDKENGLYYGLAFGEKGTLYAAQGAAGRVAVLQLSPDGKLNQTGSIKTGPDSFPAGLAVDGRGILYVTDNDPHIGAPKKGILAREGPEQPSTAPASQPARAEFSLPASVFLFDTRSGERVGRFVFESVAGTSNFPLAVTALADGSKVYVASERDGAVYVLDARDPATPKQSALIATGAHPDALLLNRAGTRLYIANAHSDTISVLDTASDKVIGTVLLRPEIAKDLAGATPTGLALSPDEKTLYAALGDMNAVAVVSLSESGAEPARLMGYEPAGWYPTAVAATPDGKRLLVANAKGVRARIPHDTSPSGSLSSPLALLEGTVASVAVPTQQSLTDSTQRVLSNARLTPAYLKGENPLKDISLVSDKPQKIKHVIYMVKENRTYDQVLGDLPQGNGDPARCLFGRNVTPNLHALAERFVLLDNFYDCGEVSGDGWTWSTQAQANEYVQRNVPYEYSGRSHNFDYEGTTNSYPTGGFPAVGPDGKRLSDDPRFAAGGKPIPDVAEAPGGHLWDLARKAGLSYRNYGFYVAGGVRNNKGVVLPDNWPASAGLQPGGHDLAGVTDIDFLRFDLDYADSDAPRTYAEKANDDHFMRSRRKFGKYDAPSRFSEWDREFQQMLKQDPTGAAVPAFMTVRFGDDHTVGASAGKPTPRSMVADNDYAVGQIVEAISKSPIWESTAIFIIEDDAQNGPDHIDAHRSTCYVISPWIRKGSIDHTFQNTVSVIRTMELLLGLSPMCQYDAASGAILDWEASPANNAPYSAALPDEKIIGEINPGLPAKKPKKVSPEQTNAADPRQPAETVQQTPGLDELAQESAAMDFSHADRNPADALNRIIWKTVKGIDSEMPPTPHRPVPMVSDGKAAAKGQAAHGKPRDDDDD
jgi:YVTN family beta-propeller protein